MLCKAVPTSDSHLPDKELHSILERSDVYSLHEPFRK